MRKDIFKQLSLALVTVTCGLVTSYAAHAGSASHADHAAEDGGKLPQFDITSFPTQLFWLAIAFAVLYIIFSAKVLPTISSVIEQRKEVLDNDLETAERLKAEAESVQKKYENQLSEARTEAARTMKEAEAEGREKAERTLQDFQKKAEREQKNVVGRIENSKVLIFNELNTIAAEVVQLSVLKVTGVEITEKEAMDAIQSLTEEQAKAA